MTVLGDDLRQSDSTCCRCHKTNLVMSSGAEAETVNHFTSSDWKFLITEIQLGIVKCIQV